MVAESTGETWEDQVVEFLNEPVPDDVLDRGSYVVADVLSAAVAGSAVDTISDVGTGAAFGEGSSSMLGQNQTVEAGQAALVNASAGIAQEIEEGHNLGGHVGVGTVTGGFALAEHFNASGEQTVEACIKAYEVCARIEHAIMDMKSRIDQAVPWTVRNPHSTWTTVGPALAGVLCSDGDVEPVVLRETFRVAANLAVVSMHDPYKEGAPSRNFTSGFSAQAGVNAALTTLAGLTGSATAMEEVYEPVRAELGEDFDAMFDSLGTEWEVTKVYFKIYPSCRYTHAPIDAVTDISKEFSVQDVERIDVYTYRRAVDMDNQSPDNLTSAKFSIPYTLARYLVSESVELEHFDDEKISDDRVQSLADRIFLHTDETFETRFPEKWGARVEVETRDGTVYHGEVSIPKGDYRDQVSDKTLETKFHKLLGWGLGEEAADEALDAVLDMRNRDARAVGSALRPN